MLNMFQDVEICHQNDVCQSVLMILSGGAACEYLGLIRRWCTALLNGHSIGDRREDRAGLKRKMSKTENCKVKLRSLTVILG